MLKKLKKFILTQPKLVLSIAATTLITSGLIVAVFLSKRSQDIRQIASGGNCTIFTSQNTCDPINGCDWESNTCSSILAKDPCTQAGCDWEPDIVNCSNISTKANCDSTYRCSWQYDIV